MTQEYKYATLHDHATVVSDGVIANVEHANTVTISIFGTSTAFIAQFWGTLNGENWFPLEGSSLSDSTKMATSTTTLDEAWEFGVPRIASIKVKLSNIANGNVSVIINSSIE